MRIPYIELPPELQHNWWTLLAENGITCNRERPLVEKLASMQEDGFTFPDPTEVELRTEAAYKCEKEHACIYIAGSVHPEFRRYLLHVHFRSRFLSRGRANSDLAKEVLSILFNAGAQEFDPNEG